MPGWDNYMLAKWIERNNIPFHQLILEFYNPEAGKKGWIHISNTREYNPAETLTAFFQGGKVRYKQGIHK